MGEAGLLPRDGMGWDGHRGRRAKIDVGEPQRADCCGTAFAGHRAASALDKNTRTLLTVVNPKPDQSTRLPGKACAIPEKQADLGSVSRTRMGGPRFQRTKCMPVSPRS